MATRKRTIKTPSKPRPVSMRQTKKKVAAKPKPQVRRKG